MMASQVVCFLYMSKDILSIVFIIEMSRKFSLFSFSRSSVNFRLRVKSLKGLRTSSTSVKFSL